MTRLQELIDAIPEGPGHMCNVFDREERLIAILRAYHEALKRIDMRAPEEIAGTPADGLLKRFEQEFGK